ncbi:hypothetical protein [Burkholderia ubonensis]|uniref:hypothetical protein n=1 Tax=Burkholderia ubonensis TaxID=101571 RepID=UPI0012FCB941|nr:hypothetical protein [Burkholderia ubonensis]
MKEVLSGKLTEPSAYGATPQFIDSINAVKAVVISGKCGDESYPAEVMREYEAAYGGSKFIAGYKALVENIIEIEKNNSKYHDSMRNIYCKEYSPESPRWKSPMATAIRRGCKSGIVSAAQPDTLHHIHFALDEIDQNAVFHKTATHGRSFTASEIRCAFRLREKLNERLHFYENGVEVPAPWDEEKSIWNEKRCTKTAGD